MYINHQLQWAMVEGDTIVVYPSYTMCTQSYGYRVNQAKSPQIMRGMSEGIEEYYWRLLSTQRPPV